MRSVFSLYILLFIFQGAVQGQERFFRQYGNEEDLDHPFVYSLCQDSSAYLWIGTGEGLYRFDGSNFDYYTIEQGLQDNFISKLFVDSKGRLWIGHQNGSLSMRSGEKFEVIYEATASSGMIIDIAEARNGEIWILSQQEGILIIDTNLSLKKPGLEISDDPLSCLLYLGQNYFLLGAENELIYCQFNESDANIEILQRIDDYPGSKVTEILHFKENKYIIASQEEGIYQLEIKPGSKDYSFNILDNNESRRLDNIQAGIRSQDNSIWIVSMGNGISRYIENEDGSLYLKETISVDNGLISDNVRCLYEDLEGNIWFGMFGEGILKYVENSITFFRFNKRTDLNRVRALMKDDKHLWIVEENMLFKWDPLSESLIDSLELKGLPREDRVSAGYISESGRIWIGMEQSGIYTMAPGGFTFNRVYISGDDLANSINFIEGREDKVWIATKKGLCFLNTASGRPNWFTTDEGLPHNNIQHIHIDQQQKILLATLCKEIYYLDQDQNVGSLGYSNFGSPISLSSIREDADGALWVATQGNGLWKINEKEKINYSKESGLISDYCYSLVINEKGMPIVAHRGGLSSIDTSSKRVKTFGRNEGINSSVEFYPNTLCLDDNGLIWFGTSVGLLKYRTADSRGSIRAPKLNIKRILIDGEEYNSDIEEIELKPGIYEVIIEYVGIHLSNPDAVVYKTQLEGYSKDWSEISSSGRAVYDRVGHGEYNFRIIAYNENNVRSEISPRLKLKIKKAFYLRAWFYIAIIVMMLAIFYLILRIRERQQIQFQEFLQKKLDERTSEVVAQKEKIEDINKDITRSINYAQRIQTSIMPSISLLGNSFTDSFLFYLPRNIVSGDFYWYSELDKETSVIICADSTGHGVPGAFMSMIGITLIKDICSNIKLENPGQLLHELDREVKTTLNKNIDSFTPPDGMDIVAAFYKHKSRKLSIAGAINPVILYQNGEQNYVRGSSFYIGGRYEDETKIFETKEFTMNKGDKIYLFSDGYIDQFGGPRGKKFKSSGLKKLLDEIHFLPMQEQSKIMESNFMNWMGDLEQVDDVVFLGLEI